MTDTEERVAKKARKGSTTLEDSSSATCFDYLFDEEQSLTTLMPMQWVPVY